MSTGFDYMRRSILRAFYKLWDSRGIVRLRDKLANLHPSKAASLLERSSPKMRAQIEKMAQREGVPVNEYALDLLAEAVEIQDQETSALIASWQRLTLREKEVAVLVCEGKTNPEIAAQLNIAEDTVKKHVSSILRKFSLRGRGVLRWKLEGWNFSHLQKPWQK